ncbi:MULTISPECIES: prephenate dehydratase [Maribellus]|uniref:prephenate dehydratase n=1 Tax=Maribellus comscasis TaxID=2681766 RepID=A0A6I6K714_9BACT|nr:MULTISPECIES: prephenate dehydratase [Maribellus]MCG6190576.1 prephenate dehydratase [Maribellus maritimus]QGY47443.1 prephenate dehydratase [Maribellus comscasis]
MKQIAVQGIAGSFHEDAALKYFNEEIEVVECKSFTSVCELIDADKVDYAVMAIENSIAGSLLKNYQLIRDFHLRIIGEIYLHIQMNLMVAPGVKKQDITDIYSHPVALQQSMEFIEKYFPNAKLHEGLDTAAAARLICDEKPKNAAAIANLRAAEMYNLEILETGIESNKKNYTRFLILSKHGNPTEGTNKASICFEVGHFYGALAKVLNIFAENRINLNKIQSVPILGKPNEYTIHVDIEWEKTKNYDKAIHQVLKNATSLSILGEYTKGDVYLHD